MVLPRSLSLDYTTEAFAFVRGEESTLFLAQFVYCQVVLTLQVPSPAAQCTLHSVVDLKSERYLSLTQQWVGEPPHCGRSCSALVSPRSVNLLCTGLTHQIQIWLQATLRSFRLLLSGCILDPLKSLFDFRFIEHNLRPALQQRIII